MSIQKRLENLPDKPEDVNRWILIGKVKLKAQIDAIKAISRLEEGVAAHAAALSDTQDFAEKLLYAEARMGNMLAAIPEKKASSGGGTRSLPEGINKKQSHYAQTLSRNEDKIAQVVAEAREKGEVPVRQHVLREIKKATSVIESPPLPEGKFDVIYADPPWEYRNTGVEGAVAKQYATMSIEALCNLPVVGSIYKNAILLMWTTNPLLEECFPVINAWGFKYKSNICWIKKNRKSGVGFYVRGVHELLLLCTRGQCLPDRVPLSIIEADAGKHSVKPDIYETIETMYVRDKYLELFARDIKHARPKWEYWGNQVNGISS